ncbi:MAG TPA: hypothetical protein VGR89_11895 [Puia sp.]|nr:hypothetical protein [Puia sp.]
MLTAKEITLLCETLLANKWIDQQVKLDLRLSRRNVLALSKLIEIGLVEEHRASDSLLQATLRDTEMLQTIPAEMRKKADLTEMYEKLTTLIPK